MGYKFPFTLIRRDTIEKLQSDIIELRSSINNSWNWKDIHFGGDNYAGIDMTQKTALTLSAVYSALNILADTLNIPVNVMRRDEGGNKEVVTPKDEYQYASQRLLHTSPSQLHTPSEWFRIMEFSRNTRGNAVSWISRNRLGIPNALRYVEWENTDIRFDGVKLWYTFKDVQGNIIIKNAPCWDVIHVKALSSNGIIGLSPIDQAMESLAFGKATQQTGNKFFADGMTNKVVLSHPGHLEDDGRKNLDKSFGEEMKKKSTIVLEEGLKPYLLSITPAQSEFLGSREFSVTEVSRWFNIPEFMLANNDPTYSNIENFALHFITHNVPPRVRMYEQEFNWKLLGNDIEYFTEFNMDALVRADLKSQADYFVKAGGGTSWLTRNEIRSLKNSNRDEGGKGDDFFTPLNAAPDNEREQETTKSE